MAGSMDVGLHVDDLEASARVSKTDAGPYARLQVGDYPVRVTLYFTRPEQISRVMRVLTRARRELVTAHADAEQDDRPRVAA